MNTVYPIKDFELLSQIKADLAGYTDEAGKRQYLLFVCGIYLGLRISDLLRLKVSDITGDEVIRIKEKKTKKVHSFPINKDLKRIVKQVFKGEDGDKLIFESPYRKHGRRQAISRKTAYTYIHEIFRPYGIKYSIGCHTLRKTFGYMFYKKSGDISMLMLWFNHSTIDITKRYIGIDVDERARAIENFRI